jgi:hypothetical protein
VLCSIQKNGLEADLHRTSTEHSKASVFERLSSVRNAYWVLLYAAKRLSAVVECHNRDTSCLLYSRVKDSRLQSNLKVKN